MRSGGPKHDSADNVHFGLQYGIVCQNKDDELNMNRVKVKFPWLDQGDTDQSHWCQLVTPMEGKNFGWYNLPEIGDVVVVGFVQGDFRQPVILGGVWSTEDKSPETNEDGKNNFRGFRSRSGHRLILDDSAKTKVVMSDKGGKLMVGIGQFDKEGAGPNTAAVMKPPMAGNSGVAFASGEGNIEITCKGGALKLKASGGSIKMNISTTCEITAGSDMTMEGGSSAKLTAGSPTSLDAPKIDIG